MEFRTGVSLQEGKALKLQESWLPATPAKPIPAAKANPVMGERRANPGMGLPAEFFQGNPPISAGAASFANQNMLGLSTRDSMGSADQRNGSEMVSATSVYQQEATNSRLPLSSMHWRTA